MPQNTSQMRFSITRTVCPPPPAAPPPAPPTHAPGRQHLAPLSPTRRARRWQGATTRAPPGSTPGMNEARSSESCRIVRVSPAPPSRTSWCATRPASRTECTCTPSTSAPRAPSGVRRRWRRAGPSRPRPAPRRSAPRCGRGAARRVDLVRVVQLDDLGRVEEPGRLLRRTASSARRRSRSSARSGHPRPPAPSPPSQPRTTARRPASKPVVPTTTWRPCPMHQRRLPMTAPGW